jgi:phage terminase large subunit-like protein
MCFACDRPQAAILFNYIKGYFEAIPALADMVTHIGADSIHLNNKAAIEVFSNNYRTGRGRSILCAVFDEVAFFRSESFASPDVEVDASIQPGLDRVRGSMKILISSVHKRSGLLYQRYNDYYGRDSDVGR